MRRFPFLVLASLLGIPVAVATAATQRSPAAKAPAAAAPSKTAAPPVVVYKSPT